MLKKDICAEIKSQTRALVASNDELKDRLWAVQDSLTEGMEQLSFDLSNINQGIDGISAELSGINATLQWGIVELISRIGSLNTTLEELLSIARTPAQTWAYEQYEIAKDAVRRSLHEDALDYLYRAINGHGDHTGYKLEHRFHFMLGIIRSGALENTAEELADLNEAEQSFLHAAKYAGNDDVEEAARALVAASWAADRQHNIESAEQYTQQAIEKCSLIPDPHFQLAKLLIRGGRNKEAGLFSLKTAMQLDREYTLKAYADDDIKTIDKDLDNLLSKLRDDYHTAANKTVTILQEQTDKARDAIQSCPVLADMGRVLETVTSVLHKANNSLASHTYYGSLNAIESCIDAQRLLESLRSKSIEHIDGKTGSDAAEIEQIKQSDAYHKPASDLASLIVAPFSFAAIIFTIWLAVVYIFPEYNALLVGILAFTVGAAVFGILMDPIGDALTTMIENSRKASAIAVVEGGIKHLEGDKSTIVKSFQFINQRQQKIADITNDLVAFKSLTVRDMQT